VQTCLLHFDSASYATAQLLLISGDATPFDAIKVSASIQISKKFSVETTNKKFEFVQKYMGISKFVEDING